AVESGSALKSPAMIGPSGALGSFASSTNFTSACTWRSRRAASWSCQARWLEKTSTPLVRAWATTRCTSASSGACGNGPPTEHGVAEASRSVVMLHARKRHVPSTEFGGQPVGLVALVGLHYFLQADDIGLPLAQHRQDCVAA